MFRSEYAYRAALLAFLKTALAGHGMWALKGQPVSFLERIFYPDIEIDAFSGRNLETIAIVELKLNSRINLIQPQLYASSRNAPFFCAVDGFRRNPVKWIANKRFVPTHPASGHLAERRLRLIKAAIEHFNFEHFI